MTGFAMAKRSDESLSFLETGRALSTAALYRCSKCGVPLLLAGNLIEKPRHDECAGRWVRVLDKEKVAILKFLTPSVTKPRP